MANHGHLFAKKTFHKPTFCHHCTDMLWGLIQQGYICEVCNFVVHERCMKSVVTPCSTVAMSHVKTPVAHCWSEPGHFKRKFCQVCRKRLDDSSAVKCEICDYFVHTDCVELSVPNCKECATYFPGREIQNVRHIHHWREGNLASSSKCAVCKKACWSSECLAGYKCEWCGITAHAACHKSVTPECCFGILEPIYLPPHAVSIPRTEVPMETILGVSSKILKSKDVMTREMSCPRSISEEFSSGDRDTKPLASRADSESDSPASSSKGHDKDKDREEETIKVYDGNQGIRRRQFRPVHISKYVSVEQLLAAALRAFHIIKQTENYYLTDAYDDEAPVCDPHPIMNLKRREGKRPAVFLRFREDERSGEVQVYSGRLKTAQSNATIPVTDDTTVAEVIAAALDQFGLDSQSALSYRMLKLTLDKGGVTERVLQRDEKPWLMLKEHARDSVRQMENVRFHMQLAEDPHGPTVALFVGNLPPNMSQRQYENVLIEFLGRGSKFCIGPIYYEYGSVVITYEDANEAVRAYSVLRESVHDDKTLLVLLLPALASHMIPAGVTPLLVFVNVKSGGCQGLELVTSFRKLLNPYQVFDLDNGGPLPGLYVFRHINNYRILVCGGDGTIGWVLQCLDNVGQDSECSSPPCAIVPLGTGNDLARVLRWGPGYTGGEDAMTLLKDVIEAEEIRLDRWTVVFHPDEKADDKVAVNQALQVGSSQSEDNTAIYVMNNYFGIGIDADLCLDFHNAREENPNKFNSRLHNKGVYVKMGLRKMVSRKMCKDLHKEIRLEVDGRHVELPPVEGIIILNILSWGSGANPWGPEREDQFNKPNHWDGMLEIVGVTGVVHLGQIQSGLRSAMRIAQGGHIKIRLNTDMPVQVDGEPWIQSPGDVVVLKSALKATMLKKTKIKRRNTEAVMSPMATSCPSPTPPQPSQHHQQSTDE